MKHFEMDRDVREALQAHDRLVQGAIGVLANRRCGSEEKAEAIGKWEGGVRVNRREIAIKGGYVIDDWKLQHEPTSEEVAVVEAIGEVVDLYRAGGIGALSAFPTPETGDPLRSMFGLQNRSDNLVFQVTPNDRVPSVDDGPRRWNAGGSAGTSPTTSMDPAITEAVASSLKTGERIAAVEDANDDGSRAIFIIDANLRIEAVTVSADGNLLRGVDAGAPATTAPRPR